MCFNHGNRDINDDGDHNDDDGLVIMTTEGEEENEELLGWITTVVYKISWKCRTAWSGLSYELLLEVGLFQSFCCQISVF